MYVSVCTCAFLAGREYLEIRKAAAASRANLEDEDSYQQKKRRNVCIRVSVDAQCEHVCPRTRLLSFRDYEAVASFRQKLTRTDTGQPTEPHAADRPHTLMPSMRCTMSACLANG